MRGSAGTISPTPQLPRGPSFPVPSFLPNEARALLPWARRYSARVARITHASHDDLWDETVCALLRAAAYFKPGPYPFALYAKTAVCRGLARYVLRPDRAKLALRDHFTDAPLMIAPSAETCAALAEAAAAL